MLAEYEAHLKWYFNTVEKYINELLNKNSTGK